LYDSSYWNEYFTAAKSCTVLSDNYACYSTEILLQRMSDADLGIYLCGDWGHMALLDT